MSGFDLQAFLAEQRSEGVQEASEGSFTVSREKALTKLANYALPGEYSWVLKIVQAANCWEADILEIVQTRVATSFYFHPRDEAALPTDAQIISALQSGNLDGPIGLLGMALCSLVQQARLSFVLAVRRGDETQEPIYAGDDTSALDKATREQWTRMSRTGLRLTVSHFRGKESFLGRYTPTLSGVPRRDVEIVKCLEEKAFASPTAITVDRRLLTSVSCSKLGLFEVIYRPLLSGRIGDDGRLSVATHSPIPDRHCFQTIRLAPPQRGPHFLVCSLEWRVQRALATGDGPFAGLPFPPRHRVYWLRYGVVVAEKAVQNTTSGTTLCLFLPADTHRTDLTGLAIDFAEDEKKRVISLVGQAVEAINSEGIRFLSDVVSLAKDDSGEWSFEVAESTIPAAGFSVVTESLMSIVGFVRTTRDKAMESLNELIQLPGSRKKLVNQWRLFVQADLRGVGKDAEGFARLSL